MNIIHLTQEQLYHFITDNRYPISGFKFDGLTQEENEIIKTCAVEYGFKVVLKPLSTPGVQKNVRQSLSAILIVSGDFSIKPDYILETDSISIPIHVIVHQQTIANKRLKTIANLLIKDKSVTLFPGCDEEYLYEILSETADECLLKKLKNIAKGLPIYEVKFKGDGSYNIREIDRVI